MIIYDLSCENGHRFEGWFKNCDDYTQQQTSGMLCCPVCESYVVQKLPTASHISSSKSCTHQPSQDDMREVLNQLHDYVDSNFEDVGRGFADEVRKIHYGEAEQRNIKGEVSAGEAKELKDEGVPLIPLPDRPVDKNKLN